LSNPGRVDQGDDQRRRRKISPTEIEDILLAHPAAAEAAAVFRAEADPEAFRAFCQENLADFKVPNVIRIVTALPKNAMWASCSGLLLPEAQCHRLAVCNDFNDGGIQTSDLRVENPKVEYCRISQFTCN
jgi:hypothetical protein